MTSSTEVVRPLVEAVRERRAVRFAYADGPSRTVHPHVVYADARGTGFVEGIQVDGPSATPLPGWRRWRLDRVDAVEPGGAWFPVDPRLDLGDTRRYAAVVAAVEIEPGAGGC
ncbi:MAG: hypothetical protein H7Y15_15725 [Pseudonocardia sp.]|nr:hypothetical protein [Pseudonocardia sp.]